MTRVDRRAEVKALKVEVLMGSARLRRGLRRSPKDADGLLAAPMPLIVYSSIGIFIRISFSCREAEM